EKPVEKLGAEIEPSGESQKSVGKVQFPQKGKLVDVLNIMDTLYSPDDLDTIISRATSLKSTMTQDNIDTGDEVVLSDRSSPALAKFKGVKFIVEYVDSEGRHRIRVGDVELYMDRDKLLLVKRG
ncbi:MAG: hypothetical protein Q8M92_04420, partial [Candidatus Subteraquimicrobiales bacterium]|nr:hypothetical protein [Candidatus Subteraquimicrobiales bacterium]